MVKSTYGDYFIDIQDISYPTREEKKKGENKGGGYGRQEKKGREAGSLRWWEGVEKFKKASFCYLLLLIIQSKKRTQQRFLTSI